MIFAFLARFIKRKSLQCKKLKSLKEYSLCSIPKATIFLLKKKSFEFRNLPLRTSIFFYSKPYFLFILKSEFFAFF
ncbi:hypothetical protein LEP1GSC036_1401 [Leptospira weilii str. 2006001853]|uniref:Uncharacterized protein n=3 Tax=Leptospira weilii TaxID=28184 RepID=A0A828Z8P0_9LEPT|nr:hypothetical protein LEP1GSC036_1401 [Leptospira weilii str. 2006001853]EMM74360.1 hypothetical protein LEP1GSC038_4753 [Leptospira weilii str. 2006001855]EMN46018.1 hypothetical protein LEP1GSC086_2155 [Leptospira weilii str. LNT 1234]EMN91754.1 hypothetical protein LEP1GSC108_1864 [Leptospira weilii str. UI 13098]OMI18004.1 hypothetical protein BUQ74_07150 [Leptospira weilii serovar Heyan]QDK21602.1 hypothetical protein FHG67_01615 [Leptospira weilii]